MLQLEAVVAAFVRNGNTNIKAILPCQCVSVCLCIRKLLAYLKTSTNKCYFTLFEEISHLF